MKRTQTSSRRPRDDWLRSLVLAEVLNPGATPRKRNGQARTFHGSIAPGERVIAGWLTSGLMGSRFDDRAAIMAP
jgi:hypothetical protein